MIINPPRAGGPLLLERVSDGLVQRLPRRRRRRQVRCDLGHHMRGQAQAAHGCTEGTLATAAALAGHLKGALQRLQQLEQKRARRLRRTRRAASRLRRPRAARAIAPRRGPALLGVRGVRGGVDGGWRDGSGGALAKDGGQRRGGGGSLYLRR